MIGDVSRYLSGRHARTYLWCAGAAIVVCVAIWPLFPDSSFAIVPVAFLSGRHIRWTPLWEVIPCMLAAVATVLWTPNLPHIEHQGRRKLQGYAASAAVFIVISTAALPIFAGITLPPGARLGVIASNVALIAGLALIFTSVLGPTFGSLLAISAYLALIVIQHSSPEVAVHLPFGGIPENMGPHWISSGVIAGVGVSSWSVTLGRRLRATA